MPKLIASHLESFGAFALWVWVAAVALGVFPAGCSDDPGGPPVADDDAGDDDGTETDDDVEEVPSATEPWLRQETAAPGSITFDEILYHPPSDGDLEWIEIYNPMVLDMDLSGWSLDGGVTFTFVEGTIMPAGGFLVVAAAPALLENETGFADALGPYDGKLSNGGERIDLRNNSGRLIDTIEYGDDDPWPVQADGSGLSLAKIDPDAASDRAENWTASAELGGTPGESNLLDPLELPTTLELVAMEAAWNHDVSGDYPALERADTFDSNSMTNSENTNALLRSREPLPARTWSATVEPTVVLNEVAPAADSPLWVELLSVSPSTQDTGGLVLASSADGEFVLPAGELGPGEILALDDIGFSVDLGDVVFLYAADGGVVLDAVRVQEGIRGRASAGGPWRVPREATPDAPNVIDATQDVVINEIQYHRAPLSQEGEPVVARSEEWIELYNRGAAEVDLSGWQIVDAVAYPFPSGTVLAPDSYLVVAGDAGPLRAAHPDITVVGDFSGRLDNRSDRILLLDAAGNPADEVRYFDGGRWPAAADGGGSSLELRDPWADNAAAEAWAASDESLRSEWISYSYRGVAEPSAVGPDGVWRELVVGLLDAGEVLIDDLSVIQDPDTTPVELLRNGTFDAGDEHWRLLGTHRHSEAVVDPDSLSNPVLRLVATGPTGHMHNHAETTLLQPIGPREYEVSFRARWISGSNQLNTRLYFNRLPRTTLVAQPDLSGTPGEPNSTVEDNLGPTFADLGQDVAVPAPHQPVLVTISVDDPDGVEGVTLWSSVDGASFQAQAMAEGEPGRWETELEGEEAGTIVQIYVEAEDGLGAISTLPAAGPVSRALIAIDDGLAATNGLHDFRILMTQTDSDWLHEDVNLMSNDMVRATVVYEEAEVFYDVGVRIKGSERGRPQEVRLGYGVEFHAEQPFRGSHSSVLIDRSEGVGFGQREVLLNLVMVHAGSVSGEYNDLIHLLAPRSEFTGPAELQLDRFSDLLLASQFTDGDSGGLFEYELIYYPTTTDDGTAEGWKLPQPDSVIGTTLTDLGDDKEAYRWNFLIKNNEREDDYDGLIGLCQTFELSGPDFLEQANAVIDVDQWLRAFAFATLSGAVDQYGGDGSMHNAQFYLRPEDQRVLYFPHDLDFFGSYSMAVVGNSDLARLLEDPANLRSYYGHLQDIIERAYNGEYLARWCDQLGDLLPEQDFEASCHFIADRADWTLYDSPDAVTVIYPSLEFHITTGGGADFTVASTEVSLEGEAWIDVRQIALDGSAEPLDLTWVDDLTWQVIVPLEDGPNDVTLVATDLQGEVVGTDSIVVTSTAGS